MSVKNSHHKKYWIEKIRQCQESGKSMAVWCREQEIVYSTFFYWQKKLTRAPSKTASPFVEILEKNSSDTGIELRCKHVSLNLSRDFDSVTLVKCLRLLRSV